MKSEKLFLINSILDLALLTSISSALAVTQKTEGGVEALMRLDALEKDVVWK